MSKGKGIRYMDHVTIDYKVFASTKKYRLLSGCSGRVRGVKGTVIEIDLPFPDKIEKVFVDVEDVILS